MTKPRLICVRVFVNNEFYANHFTHDDIKEGSEIMYEYHAIGETHIVEKNENNDLIIHIKD